MGISLTFCRGGLLALLLLLPLSAMSMASPAQSQSLLGPFVQSSAEGDAAATGQGAGSEAGPALTAAQTQVLVDLLRDDRARAALIAELERLAADGAATAPGTTATPATTADTPESVAGDEAPLEESSPADEGSGIGREIARQSKEIAEGVVARAGAFWESLMAVPGVFSGLAGIDTALLLEALADLALVIVASVGLLLLLGFFARRLYRWMGGRARMGFSRRTLVYLASVAVDALVVLTAWAGGYLVALIFFGEFGQIALRQTLYLNAFLVVEIIKLAIRAVLSPSLPELRPVRVPDHGARRTYRVLAIVAGIIGYGELLAVPIAALYFGYDASRSISALLLLVALTVMVVSVMRNRRAVADWLSGEGARAASRGRFLRGLARFWHVPMLIYLVALFVMVVTRRGDVLLPVLASSARILAVAAIGWVIAGLISRAIAHGIRLPAGVNHRLPLLERRLNAFVPRILLVLRIVILIIVVAYALGETGLIDLRSLLEGPVGLWITTTAGTVAMLLLAAFVLWLAVSSWVEYRLNPNLGRGPTAREQTLLTLLRNAVTVVLIAITLMFVLSEIGIDIAPLIASAGILGLAIGFGAQKMVQDIISGIFIQLEHAVDVGDWVAAGGVSGTVERLTIRSVSLRDLDGVYHVVPFSSVDVVSNYMREFGYFVANIRISYRMDVDAAKQAMHDAFEELRADPLYAPNILGDLEWFGVNNLTESAVVLRARIKALAGYQWSAGRAYNEIIRRVFAERDIEIPFPHQTIYLGQGPQGEIPTAVRSVTTAPAAPSPEPPDEPGGEEPDAVTPPTDDDPSTTGAPSG